MRNRRRARQAILLGLALFALCQGALAAIILIDGSSFRDPAHGRKLGYLDKRLAEIPDKPGPLTILQVGSSRTAAGLRGPAAEPWLAQRLGRPVVLFNMGFLGDGPIRTLVKVKQLLDDGLRPDLLLVEVLPPLLSEKGSFGQASSESIPARQLRYDEMRLLARCAAGDRPDLPWQWWLAQADAAWTYRIGLLSRFAPALLPFAAHWDPLWDIDDSGWLPPVVAAGDRPRALEAARKNFVPLLEGFKVSPRLLGVVQEAIELAQAEGIPVALIVMPEGPAFRSWYPPGAWEQIEWDLTEVSRTCSVPLLNFRDAVAESHFTDSHHLDAEGALLFTRLLAERIEPLLRPAREAR
jgi:hypothetical protein